MDLDLHTLKAAQQPSTSPVGTPTHKNLSVGSPPMCECAPDAAVAGWEERVDAIPVSSAVSPWSEVATGNCLLSAGTEGRGYQLLRVVEARNLKALQHCCACTHTMHPCTCSVLQCPAASHGHAWSSHLWIPGAHCDQPPGFQTRVKTALR